MKLAQANAFALKLLYVRENYLMGFFFEELTNSLCKANESYEHIIIMGALMLMLHIEEMNSIR